MIDDRTLAKAQFGSSQVRSGTVNVTFGAKGCCANQADAPAAVAGGPPPVTVQPTSIMANEQERIAASLALILAQLSKAPDVGRVTLE